MHMLQLPQRIPFDTEDWWLYSELPGVVAYDHPMEVAQNRKSNWSKAEFLFGTPLLKQSTQRIPWSVLSNVEKKKVFQLCHIMNYF